MEAETVGNPSLPLPPILKRSFQPSSAPITRNSPENPIILKPTKGISWRGTGPAPSGLEQGWRRIQIAGGVWLGRHPAASGDGNLVLADTAVKGGARNAQLARGFGDVAVPGAQCLFDGTALKRGQILTAVWG